MSRKDKYFFRNQGFKTKPACFKVFKNLMHQCEPNVLLDENTILRDSDIRYLFKHYFDGADSDSNFSGKFGGSVAATERLGVYGEVSFANFFDEETDNTYNTKLGTKFTF